MNRPFWKGYISGVLSVVFVLVALLVGLAWIMSGIPGFEHM